MIKQKENEKAAGQHEEITEFHKNLLLFNDDYHTFDFVIDSLIEVCGHAPEQAEQCALIAHYKGKATINKGDEEQLKPQYAALTDRGLIVLIGNQ